MNGASQTALESSLCLRPMQVADLDRVMAIEVASYAFPWTRGNFIDSLAAGYVANILLGADGDLIGYSVAMPGVDEMHLLNITVAAAFRGRRHASHLVEALRRLCRDRQAAQLWLEVRRSNDPAQAIYRHLGFVAVGVRKNYYPAPAGRREDAVVMSLAISGTKAKAGDALD